MRLDTIYVVHHTHTDVGFTNDQPIFWEMQYRFVDDALRLIDRFVGNPPVSRCHCFTKVKPRRHREHGENPAKKASVNSVTPW